MVRRQESVTGWFPHCSSDCIRFGHFFFLFSIQGYGKDKPVCQFHCRKHSTFPFIFCSVYSEPMAQMEFLSYYSFRIHFVVCGIPDSFTNLQNLIRAKARPATAGKNKKSKIPNLIPQSPVPTFAALPRPASGLCVSKNPRVSVSLPRPAPTRVGAGVGAATAGKN